MMNKRDLKFMLARSLIGLFQFDVDYMVTISIQAVHEACDHVSTHVLLPDSGVFLSNYANEL